MGSSRFSLAGVGVALMDYVLITVLAGIGSLWWLAAWLGFNPSITRILDGDWVLAMAWVGLMLILCWRGMRRASWFATSYRRIAGIAVLLALAAVVLLWIRSLVMEADNAEDEVSGLYLLLFQAGVFLFCTAVLVVGRHEAHRRGWISNAGRIAVAAGAAGYLVYLSWDESLSPSVARNHAALAGRSEDEASYRLTLRYTPTPGGGVTFIPPRHKLEWYHKGEKRRAYLLDHRSEIEANWAELADVRGWWAEMAAQPGLGDRPVKSLDQPFIQFQPVRAYAQHATAIASLQALDGDGDGAMATVFALYDVAARLEPASATLVRSMIARLLMRQAMETAAFVLDHATVSPEMCAKFSARLEATEGGGRLAKALVLTECAFWTKESISSLARPASFGGENVSVFLSQGVSRILAPVTLNPQATANLLHDHCEQIALCAEAGDLERLKAVQDGLEAKLFGGFQVKNFSGRSLLQMSVPGFSAIVKSYWETEDLRTRLIQRLQEAPRAH